MEKHIKQENLINFVEKKLDLVESDLITQHLENCSNCRGKMKEYKKIIGLMKKDESADASGEDIVWAKNLFVTRSLETEPTLKEKVLAVLKMELSPSHPEFGERSTMASSIRQMLYQTRDCSIDLRVSKKEKGIELTGQILGENYNEIKVGLESAEKNYSVKTNEISEFVFSNLIEGNYTLKIIGQNNEIVIENLDLR